MKKRTILIASITMLTISLMLIAAKPKAVVQLCIPMGSNDVPRVKTAYGFGVLGLGRDATTQEVQDRIRDDIINTTKAYERGQFTPPPMEMQPATPTAAPTATP